MQNRLSLYLAALTLWLIYPACAVDVTEAHWNLGNGGSGSGYPLSCAGQFEFGAAAQGTGALPDTKVARLTNAYFNAGPDIHVKGEQITVYLRARDPKGQWTYALFNKRGSHDTVNFNLFSIDLPDTPGPDIGFELHSKAGFAMVSFPVSRIDPTAWHDLAGRYDGKTIEIICDGQVMAKKSWRGGPLTQNDEPVLIGAETDNGHVIRNFTGEIQSAALWASALSDAALAKLMHKDKIMPDANYVEPYMSPIHFRPAVGALADTIPFFWKGEYHIFYLHAGIGLVPWEHIVSTDLIHWRELPPALVSDGDANGPDGGEMFTGSVVQGEGGFHIFYTGHNDRNPQGRETIMHATSSDLIHWTKHPEQGFRADGLTYENTDFRDPFVFWHEPSKTYWMILCARDAKTHQPVQGMAQSTDLLTWKQVAPLPHDPPAGGGSMECPDVFHIGPTWYLIHSPSAGTTDARYADDAHGPYHLPPTPAIDTPILYAAKRMFDGKRHILTGWVRDLGGETDNGNFGWGGDQCVPREVYAGPQGQLFFRPVPEATALFTTAMLDLANKPTCTVSNGWRYTAAGLESQSPVAPSRCAWDVPDNYMLSCKLRLAPKTIFSLGLRQQDDPTAGYKLTLNPQTQQAELSSPKFHYPRHIDLDASKPITLQVFAQGSIIECFINNAYAFTCRAYDYRHGQLSLETQGGQAQVTDLAVKLTP